MSYLFSDIWMYDFGTLWNSDRQIVDVLSQEKFDAKIGYGFLNSPHPTGLLIVLSGRVEYAGLYKGELLDWDIRANVDDWEKWLKTGLGLDKIGYVVSQKRLRFYVGNYHRLMRNPELIKAFLRSFELMSKVRTRFDIPMLATL